MVVALVTANILDNNIGVRGANMDSAQYKKFLGSPNAKIRAAARTLRHKLFAKVPVEDDDETAEQERR